MKKRFRRIATWRNPEGDRVQTYIEVCIKQQRGVDEFARAIDVGLGRAYKVARKIREHHPDLIASVERKTWSARQVADKFHLSRKLMRQIASELDIPTAKGHKASAGLTWGQVRRILRVYRRRHRVVYEEW